jgi:hypothetical protein
MSHLKLVQAEPKTETVAEFLARGGKIKYVAAKTEKKPRAEKFELPEEVIADESVDFSALPMALKIKFGIK